MASEGVKERANTSAGGIATDEPRETAASRSASGRTFGALIAVMGSCQRAIGYCDSPRRNVGDLAWLAVTMMAAPPKANHGFQRMRLQWVSRGPMLARSPAALVARSTSSTAPRVASPIPTTARSNTAACRHCLGARGLQATAMTAMPIRRSNAVPKRPKMMKLVGRRSARSGPADEARPIEPPSVQNRWRHANKKHHTAATVAAKLHGAEPALSTA